jgi:hypothetical protein
MNETLLYIAKGEAETNESDKLRAAEHVRVAEALGFNVLALYNGSHLEAEYEDQLVDLASSEECVGLWVDVKADDVSDRTRRLIFAAHSAGKKLLGYQTSSSDKIVENITHFLGVPDVEAK